MIRIYWSVLILPAIVIVLSFILKSAVGPFWQYADPSYIFLLNSLNLVKGLPSAFFDQPGFPLQLLGQLVIYALNIGHSTGNTLNAVLTNPEYYLNAINIILIVSGPITALCAGIYTFRKTNDPLAALLIQLPNVFLLTFYSQSNNHPSIYTNVNSEPLLLAITNIFNIFILKLYFFKTDKEEVFTILSLGFITGLGVATKLNFLPLMVLPLILSKWQMKPFFIIMTIISFVLWTIPFVGLYPKLWHWTIGLLTHTGIYGGGDRGFIDIHNYLFLWTVVFRKYFFFILFSICVLILSVVQIIKNHDRRSAFFTGAISFTILLQLAVILKHFDEHYLVMVTSSLGPLFVLFYIEQIPKKIFFKALVFILIVIATIGSSAITLSYASRLALQTKEVVGFNNMIHTKYPNSVYIGSYLQSPIRNTEYALFMGNDSSGGGEEEDLDKLYPDNLSLFTESRDISGTCTYGLYHFSHPVWADDLLSKYPRIIFINSGYDFSETPYIVKPLESGKYSKAYLLVGSTEKAAKFYFNASVQLLQKGQFKEAFACALRSKQFHFQPQGMIDYYLSILYSRLKH